MTGGFAAAGDRALHVEGSLRSARTWYEAAYRQAEQLGDAAGMAGAALGLGGLWVHEHRSAAAAEMVRTRQRDALGRIDPRSRMALRLRLRLAAEEDYLAGQNTRILGLLAEARRDGGPIALAEGLSLAHQCLLGPEYGGTRLRLARELIGTADRTGRRDDLLLGLLWHTVDLLLVGDRRADRYLVELRCELAETGHLTIEYVADAIEVMLRVRAGRLAEAEALAARCAERGKAAGDVHAATWYGIHLATIRWYQGRIGELVPLLSDLAGSPSVSAIDNSAFAGLALAAAAAGDRRVAAGALARLQGQGLAALPRSSSWLMAMYGAVEAAHLLGDTETAAQAYELLTPFAQMPVMTGIGVGCLGSVRHCLGVAALTMGDLDEAEGHLRLAIRDNLALGHWPAATLSRFRLGQALRGAAASDELTLARKEAEAMDMVLPDAEFGAGVRCERDGKRWRLMLGARSASVDDSVGMRHLAILLANPGQEVRAAELAADLAQGPESGVTQPLLDDTARQQYRARLAQLDADIDEYEALNDQERATAVRAERDWLIAELTAATGLAGRERRFADGEERARIAVGKAIRRALQRIGTADPIIGAELTATVHTGVRCCYRPG